MQNYVFLPHILGHVKIYLYLCDLRKMLSFKSKYYRHFLLALGLIASLVCNAQEVVYPDHYFDDDFIKASLVITDPGNVLYSCLGHAFFRMECPTQGLDVCFSYESESVRDRIGTFFKGNLKMGLFCIPTADFLEAYEQEGRGVYAYQFNLPLETRRNLWRILDEHVSEGDQLPYDYIKRGCAVSCVYLLNEAIAGDRIDYSHCTTNLSRTRREVVADALADFPWTRTFLHLIVGSESDKNCIPQEQLITPQLLVETWQQATLNGALLIQSNPEILTPSHYVAAKPCFTPLMLAIILLIFAIASLIWQIPCVDVFFLIIQSVIALILTYLIVFSSLPCTNWSWLFVVFNPLPLIFWHWRKYWSIWYIALVCIWTLALIFYPHLLTGWEYIILAIAFAISLNKYKTQNSLQV